MGNAKGQRCAMHTPAPPQVRLSWPGQARPVTRLCPSQRTPPLELKEVQSSPVAAAGDHVQRLADTRFTRKPTAVHNGPTPRLLQVLMPLPAVRPDRVAGPNASASLSGRARSNRSKRFESRAALTARAETSRFGRPVVDTPGSTGPFVTATDLVIVFSVYVLYLSFKNDN
jgi:hypothetical protein